MGNLLFSPSGRIGSSSYTKGILILSTVFAVVNLLPFVGMGVATAFTFLSFFLVVPFLFLSIKRAHDGGKSGWMSLVYLLIYIVLLLIASTLITKFFTGNFDLEAIKVASEEAAVAGDIRGALNAVAGPAKAQAIPSAIAAMVVGYALSFIVNAMTPNDAHDNHFGPVTGAA